MNSEEIEKILKKQKEYFESGKTLSYEARMKALSKLKNTIRSNEALIHEALKKDLGKSNMESFMCETGLAVSEITWLMKHLKGLMRNKPVQTPLTNFAGFSFRNPHPYGNVLIMSPWNYPVLLTIDPLADALAAGNTCVVKPSAYAENVSRVLCDIISEAFPEGLIAMVRGGRAENTALLNRKFDKIFFTGSKNVGKEVLRHAAENLTPVVLELGGKSPCIITKTANLKLAAKRIVFGKFLNCGQTCVAPDYILCEKSVENEFVKALTEQIKEQYGEKPLENPDYGKIINRKHFDRLKRLIDEEKTVFGGRTDEASLRIEPTVMTNVTLKDAVMGEEIFGPVLPIIGTENLSEAIKLINSQPEPLALYLFSSDKSEQKRVLSGCNFGGGCINDTIVHLATSTMPFGGVGESGMGAYHGKYGFETFSHYRSIIDKKTFIDLPFRYQRYNSSKEKLLRMFLK